MPAPPTSHAAAAATAAMAGTSSPVAAAAGTAELDVCVGTVAGELVARLRLPRATPLTSLKRLIEGAAGVPESEQQLLLGTDILAEHAVLGELEADKAIGGTGHMWITLVRVTRRWALSGDSTGVLRLWDLECGLCLQVLAGHDPVRCVAMDWAARVATCGTASGALKVWDLSRGACLRELVGPSSVRCVAMDWSSRLALSGSSDKILRLWDLGSSRCIQELVGHDAGVNCVAAGWPASRAISGGDDGLLLFWDLDSGDCLWRVHAHITVQHVDMDWQSCRAISAGSGGTHTLRLWDLEHQECVRELSQQKPALPCLAADLAGQIAASGMCGGSALQLWDLEGGACLRELACDAAVHCIALSWPSRLALVGTSDAVLRLLDLDSGACLLELEGHSEAVSCLAMS